jgi:hypothetical protein
MTLARRQMMTLPATPSAPMCLASSLPALPSGPATSAPTWDQAHRHSGVPATVARTGSVSTPRCPHAAVYFLRAVTARSSRSAALHHLPSTSATTRATPGARSLQTTAHPAATSRPGLSCWHAASIGTEHSTPPARPIRRPPRVPLPLPPRARSRQRPTSRHRRATASATLSHPRPTIAVPGQK